ncbi:NRT1/ PTR family 4.3-like protein [Tanacetum coccineum]|uniref:NRT1/ PTR family 4.3-like protein n=1 Tax=Tanacetum coccineum TaxID=301880 RepID=A0ABQ5EQR0_9ASTR
MIKRSRTRPKRRPTYTKWCAPVVVVKVIGLGFVKVKGERCDDDSFLKLYFTLLKGVFVKEHIHSRTPPPEAVDATQKMEMTVKKLQKMAGVAIFCVLWDPGHGMDTAIYHRPSSDQILEPLHIDPLLTVKGMPECQTISRAKGVEALIFFVALYLVALGSGCMKQKMLARGALSTSKSDFNGYYLHSTTLFNAACFSFSMGELIALILIVWIHLMACCRHIHEWDYKTKERAWICNYLA